MVLAAASPINAYVGNGGASTFAFTFPVFDQTVLLVTVVNPTLGSSSTLALGTDYTVTGLSPSGDPASTGSIVLVNASQVWLSAGNLATGWNLVIQINIPLAQTFSIRNQGDYLRGYLENALDALEMQIQQLQLAIGSQLILPTGVLPSAFSPVLPSAITASPGLAIVVNSTGTGLALGAGGSVTLPVTIAQGGTGSTTALSNGRVMISKSGKIIESDGSDYSMNSGKITSLKNGTAAQDAVAYGQLPGQIGTITNWASYTPTFGASFGTTASVFCQWRRVGDTLEVRGFFQVGTVTGAGCSISLPNSIVTDNSGKLPTDQLCGYVIGTTGPNIPRYILAVANSNTIYMTLGATATNARTSQNANTLFVNNEVVLVQFWVPINGWSI